MEKKTDGVNSKEGVACHQEMLFRSTGYATVEQAHAYSFLRVLISLTLAAAADTDALFYGFQQRCCRHRRRRCAAVNWLLNRSAISRWGGLICFAGTVLDWARARIASNLVLLRLLRLIVVALS